MPSQVGKTKVGGIDFNKPRMRWVAEAVLALSAAPDGFTDSELAKRVQALGGQGPAEYGTRQAAYDLKKLRGKQMVRRMGNTPRYEPIPRGLKAMTALVVLRDKAIKPFLAAAQEIRPTRAPQNPRAIDQHYDTIRVAMKAILGELGLAA